MENEEALKTNSAVNGFITSALLHINAFTFRALSYDSQNDQIRQRVFGSFL